MKVAIATPGSMNVSSLLQAASMARRGGLSAADALRAITLTPAELLGVADRVGSLAAGKDADFVLNGAPTEPGGASTPRGSRASPLGEQRARSRA